MKEIITFGECLTRKQMESLKFSIDTQHGVAFYLPSRADFKSKKEYNELKKKLILLEDHLTIKKIKAAKKILDTEEESE